MKKVNRNDKNDPVVRMAIWVSYKYQGTYTPHPIDDIHDLVIDHIIPEKVNSEIFEEIKSQLELPEDFKLNSLKNYMPTIAQYNGLKSNDMLPRYLMERALNLARKKEVEINDFIDKFIKKVEFIEATTLIKFNSENIEDLEKLLFTLLDEPETWEESEWNTGGNNKWYDYTKSRVKLNGMLPNEEDLSGYCVFSFRTLKIMGVVIEVDDKEIIERFIEGMETPIESGFRKFITYIKNDNVGIRLGKTLIELKMDETKELCDIIDAYCKEYLKRLQILEDKYKSINFFSDNEEYRLIKISWELWRALIDFQNEHDVDSSIKSPWNIFDRSHFQLKVYTKNHDFYGDGYHSIVTFKKDVNSDFFGQLPTKNEGWIVWNKNNVDSSYRKEIISKENKWDCEMTFNFLIEELIPEVIYNFSKKDKKIRLNTRSSFNKAFKIDNYGWIRKVPFIERAKNIDELLECVKRLQHFFSIHSRIYINKINYVELLKALFVVYSNTKSAPIGYLRSKFDIFKEPAIGEVANQINIFIDHYDEEKMKHSSFEVYFRCFMACIDEGMCTLTGIQLDEIIKGLKPFIDQYNRLITINKNHVEDFIL